MKSYRLSRRAKLDIDRIWLYIAAQSSPEIADRFLDHLREKFPTLAGMPDIGRLSDAIELGLKCFPFRDYLIYYRRAPRGGILIVRVIHGMRNQQKAWEN